MGTCGIEPQLITSRMRVNISDKRNTVQDSLKCLLIVCSLKTRPTSLLDLTKSAWIFPSRLTFYFLASAYASAILRIMHQKELRNAKLMGLFVEVICFHPTAQDFSHTPGLSHATPGRKRGFGVKYFTDRSDASFIELFHEAC